MVSPWASVMGVKLIKHECDHKTKNKRLAHNASSLGNKQKTELHMQMEDTGFFRKAGVEEEEKVEFPFASEAAQMFGSPLWSG